MNFMDQLSRALRPMSNRIRSIVARGVIKQVDDSGSTQKIGSSFLSNEYIDDMERPQTYGFTTVPYPGMGSVAVFVEGDRSRGIIIAVADRSFRIKNLKQGEVALYTDEGDTIILGRNHNITATTETFTINCNSFNVNAAEGINFQTPTTSISGDISVGGNSDVSGNIKASDITGSNIKGDTVKAGSIDLTKHTHTGVTPGKDSTGPAQ